jgi:hypothetical protein
MAVILLAAKRRVGTIMFAAADPFRLNVREAEDAVVLATVICLMMTVVDAGTVYRVALTVPGWAR